MSEQKEKKTKIESEWDKKRIIIFSILTILLLILGYWIKDSVIGKNSKPAQTVKGVSTQINVKKNVQNQIDSLKQEVESIDLVEIASSSPQVQKIINDIKALKDYPNNQIKQACMKACEKL